MKSWALAIAAVAAQVAAVVIAGVLLTPTPNVLRVVVAFT